MNPRKIVLIGMMGCGKTSVGDRLSQLTGWPYLDNDRMLREATGHGPDEVAASQSIDVLHDLEMEQFRIACSFEGNAIVGAAASVIEHPETLAILKGNFVVYLRATPETLAIRIVSGTGRPMVDKEALAILQQLLQPRARLYEAAANLVIDVDRIEIESIARQISEAFIDQPARLTKSDPDQTG